MISKEEIQELLNELSAILKGVYEGRIPLMAEDVETVKDFIQKSGRRLDEVLFVVPATEQFNFAKLPEVTFIPSRFFIR